jgi:hypothetical protein
LITTGSRIGTLVGFFFGNTAGSTGKERAQVARVTAEKRLGRMYGVAYKHDETFTTWVAV